MRCMRLWLVVLAMLTVWAPWPMVLVASSSEAVNEREAGRSEMMQQYKRRWAAIESVIEAMRAEKNALYVRHEADVDVRAWAIEECLTKLAAAEQQEQQELSQRIDAALAEARQTVDALASGCDYFAQKRGSLLRGIIVDGQAHPEPYAVHVPSTYDAGRNWPLFVYLHGGGGSVDQARYALDRVYAAATSERETSEPPALATGHYVKIWLPRRGEHWAEPANEDSVFAAIDDMKANYNIDADRVYVQGFSMGGFASMHFAVRYPGKLAGSGPSGMPNVGAFLPFVENLTNLPLYLCHGSRDDTCQPENSLMLFDRLRAGSYDVMLVMDAQLGHGTPAETRAGQEFWLLSKRRNRYPRRVVYVTDDLRYHRAYWIDILELSPVVKPLRAKMPDDFEGDPPRIASVEATRYTISKQAVLEPVANQRVARIEAVCVKPGEFEVKTEHIESFAILLSAELARPGEAVIVSVDGQPALTLPWPGDGRLVFVRGSDGTWGG